MEIVKKTVSKSNTAKQSKPSSKKTTVSIVKQVSQKKKKNSSKKPSSVRKQEMDQFMLGMTRPDIAGPIRIPREGGANRTVLGMDKTYTNGGATATYNLYVPNTSYSNGTNVATRYTAATDTTAWGGASNVVVGQQFPGATSFFDINLVGLCLVIDYIGAPLNITGEILLGTFPMGSAVNAASFNTLANYPGVIRMPLKNFLDGQTKAVFGKKVAPDANSFTTTASECPQYEIPFVALTRTAADNVVSVIQYRTFEGRPIINSLGSLYEKTSDSFSTDLNRYQDALAEISEVVYPVMDGYSEYFRELALGALGSTGLGLLGPALNFGTSVTMGMLSNRHLSRLRDSNAV